MWAGLVSVLHVVETNKLIMCVLAALEAPEETACSPHLGVSLSNFKNVSFLKLKEGIYNKTKQ